MLGWLRRPLLVPGLSARVPGGLALALASNPALNRLGVPAMRPFGLRLALVVEMLAGNRNQVRFLVVLAAAADPGVMPFFAIGQVPMFLSPCL